MITTQFGITFAESPWDRQAGNESSGSCLGLVSAQDCETDSGKIVRTSSVRVQGRVAVNRFLPARNVLALRLLETAMQTGDSVTGSFSRISAKTEGEHKLAF